MSLGVAALGLGLTGCVGDLDKEPINPNEITDVSGEMDKVFADIFLSFSCDGVNNSSPVKDFDGGMSNFGRAMFTAECMPTDEASWLWDPEKFGDLKYGKVTPSVPCVYGFYSRLMINITLCNQFIQSVEDGTFVLDDAARARSVDYVRQAKIMRSLCYYYMLSFYDKVPYADESTPVGSLPAQLPRAEVYANVTSTLEEIVASYGTAQVPHYGFVGLDAAESILAKIYLNGEVFAGRADYDKCYTHCKNIIDRLGHGGHYGNGLARSYNTLFGYNNDQYVLGNPGNEVNEIILAYINDRVRLKAWGNATFLIAGWIGSINAPLTVGKPTDDKTLDGKVFVDEKDGNTYIWKYYSDADDLKAAQKEYDDLEPWQKEVNDIIDGVCYSIDLSAGGGVDFSWYNTNDGWKCMVTRKSFVKLFDWDDTAMSVSKDRRVANWQTSRHGFPAENISLLGGDYGKNGYLAVKYSNWAYNEDGTINKDLSPEATTQVGGDCVGIRLAEIYLTAAEAILQGGGGSPAEALKYVNYIRQRAFGDTDHNWSSLTMEQLRDERARELYSENVRRTDLIRWNQWTSGYTWDWKGGVKSGTNLPEYTKLYPIPMRVMISSNFEQTTGY